MANTTDYDPTQGTADPFTTTSDDSYPLPAHDPDDPMWFWNALAAEGVNEDSLPHLLPEDPEWKWKLDALEYHEALVSTREERVRLLERVVLAARLRKLKRLREEGSV